MSCHHLGNVSKNEGGGGGDEWELMIGGDDMEGKSKGALAAPVSAQSGAG